ncbi:tubby C-terminal-like domain-containing protein [Pterulicium gracile]|uniref:Tubby C-terminal-like domain-containing protein n=1 Tax=Pterulicium gracile TaxID=1884261 RepID=A0A5C3Q573_9AGAR|nr:tubby C-terminal-like domain-containing protein [Pterula gracilis]
MGASPSTANPPPPFQRVSETPIGVVSIFAVHEQPITLKIQEQGSSITGDSFHIKNAASDQPVLEYIVSDADVALCSNFLDLQGQTLFHLKKRLIALHATFDGISSTNDETILFTVEKSFSDGKTRLNVTFRNAADGNHTNLALRGDFFIRSAVITLQSPEGPIVARFSREYMSARGSMFGKQTYFLTVAPGVDISLLVAVCVCFDEMEDDSRRRACRE